MGFADSVGLLFKINADGSQATSELKNLRSQIARDTKGIADEGGSNINQFGNSFTSVTPKMSALTVAVGNLYAQLAVQLASGLKQGASAVLDYSSRLEQVAISFRTLTGSAATTTKLLKEIQDFAKETPFEFGELAGLSQKLLGANVEAAKIVPLLRDVGNAVSAVGGSQEDLNGVVRALTQMISLGKVSSEELNQLSERNINGFKILADQLGKTQAEVRDLIKDGQISADLFIAAFQKFSQTKFGDAMAEQSKTFAGSMSNIKDALLQVSQTAFEPLYKQISDLSRRFSTDIQAQGSDFRGVGTVIAKYIGEGLGAGIDAIIRGLGAYIGTRLGEIFTGKAFIDPIVSGFVGGLYGSLEKAILDFGQRTRDRLGYEFLKAKPSGVDAQAGASITSTLKRKEAETPLPSLLPSTEKVKKAGKTIKTFADEFKDFADDIDFNISRIKGGAINSGSKHPLSLAGDLGVRGKTNSEITNALAEGIQKGFRAVDERLGKGSIPGVKTTGPNIHFESRGSQKPSLFIEDRPDLYGGRAGLDYLKKLDEDRRNKKTSNDEIEDFAKKQAEAAKKVEEEKRQAIEETVRLNDEASERVLNRARQDAAEISAINKKLLAERKISQDEFDSRESGGEIELLNKEQILLEDRLRLAREYGTSTIEIEEEIAAVQSAIRTKRTEEETAEYLASRKRIEEIAALRRAVLEDERRLTDFRKEQERKVLVNQAENGTVKARFDALVVLREFDIAEAKRRKEIDDEEIERARQISADSIKGAIDEKERLIEIEKLYKNQLLLTEEEFQAAKKEIEENYKQDNESLVGTSGIGGLGDLAGDALSGLLGDAENKLKLFAPIGDAISASFNKVAQAVGASVKAFVLFGSAGGSFRKFAAELLASIAQMAAVQAVWNLAEGFAKLALAYFGHPTAGPSATQHFIAAAVYGGIAGVAAIAGRATAGNSFKQQSATGAGGNNGLAGGNGQQSNASGAAGGYYTTNPGGENGGGIREEGRRGTQETVRHEVDLTDSSGRKRQFLIQTLKDDFRSNGDIREMIKTFVEQN